MSKEIDANGFWHIKDNPISKEGIYPYLGRQISPDFEPDKIYYVLRPREELRKAADTFKNVPILNDHEMIGEGFTPADNVKEHGALGEKVYERDGKLYANVIIRTDELKNLIESGKKELSLGYRCRYEVTPGVWQGQHYDAVQRDLIGNHIALVQNGRMGHEVRVMDSALKFACDAMDIEVSLDTDKWITIHPNGKENKGRPLRLENGESPREAIERKFKNQNTPDIEKQIKEYPEVTTIGLKGDFKDDFETLVGPQQYDPVSGESLLIKQKAFGSVGQAPGWEKFKNKKALGKASLAHQEQLSKAYQLAIQLYKQDFAAAKTKTLKDSIIRNIRQYEEWNKDVPEIMAWIKKTHGISEDFDESKVNRNKLGEFATQPGGKANQEEKTASSASAGKVVKISGNELGSYTDIKELRQKAVDYYKANLQGKTVEHPKLGKVLFSGKGINKFISSGADENKIKMLPVVSAIIKNGKYNGKPEEPSHTRTDGIIKFYRIYQTVVMGNKKYQASVLVGEDEKGNKFYNLNPYSEEYTNDEASRIPTVRWRGPEAS